MIIKKAILIVTFVTILTNIPLLRISSMPSATTMPSATEDKDTTSQTSAKSTSNVKPTQLKTIELETTSKKSIVSISKKELIKELSSLFDKSKKLLKEMTLILSNMEELRKNLVNSFDHSTNKLDTILQDISFKTGKFKGDTLQQLNEIKKSSTKTKK